MNTIINQQKIPFLVHFTKTTNLPGICKSGLIPRATLESLGAAFSFNNSYRFDGYKTGVCLSVAFPNYKMFYKYRKAAAADWCVVGIHPSILLTGNPLFFHKNAASSEFRSAEMGTLCLRESFQRFFNEVEGKPTRAEMKIPSWCSTDPQAEIIFQGVVPKEFIIGIAFESEAVMLKNKDVVSPTPALVKEGFFKPRVDFGHWR